MGECLASITIAVGKKRRRRIRADFVCSLVSNNVADPTGLTLPIMKVVIVKATQIMSGVI
jgi:hypothetical protein